MTGAVDKRGPKTWRIRIHLGMDPITKKRETHTETIHGKKSEADARLASLLTDLEKRGHIAKSKGATVGEVIGQYLDSVAHALKQKTIETHRWTATAYLLPNLGNVLLDRLTPGMVQGLYNKLQQTNGLAPATIRRIHAVLHKALGHAIKWRMLHQNPASAVELPRLSRIPKMRALTLVQAKMFIEAIRDTPFALFFELMLFTGCRPGEMYGLKWLAIDWATQSLRIECGLSRRKGGGFNLEDPKTARGRRLIPLSPPLIAKLRQHRAKQDEQRNLIQWPEGRGEFVFTNGAGNPLDQRNLVLRHYKPALQRAGLPKETRLYDLRHSAVTLLLALEENAKVVSERVGHASVAFTLDRYAHVLPNMQRQASNKMQEMMWGAES